MIPLSMTLTDLWPHFKVMKFFEDEYRKNHTPTCMVFMIFVFKKFHDLEMGAKVSHRCVTPRLTAKRVDPVVSISWASCSDLYSTRHLPFPHSNHFPAGKGKGKGKMHTLDIAPVRSESSPHRSAQVWRVFSRDFAVKPAHPSVCPVPDPNKSRSEGHKKAKFTILH